jgi:hypothetical protein
MWFWQYDTLVRTDDKYRYLSRDYFEAVFSNSVDQTLIDCSTIRWQFLMILTIIHQEWNLVIFNSSKTCWRLFKIQFRYITMRTASQSLSKYVLLQTHYHVKICEYPKKLHNYMMSHFVSPASAYRLGDIHFLDLHCLTDKFLRSNRSCVQSDIRPRLSFTLTTVLSQLRMTIHFIQNHLSKLVSQDLPVMSRVPRTPVRTH